MRKAVLAFVAGALLTLTPSSAFAWGAEGHRLIMWRAIELLPPELKPFFEHFREELVVRVNDPDVWRNVPWDDDANHFVDFGVPELGQPPFTALPRERGAALAKFGANRLKSFGLLPWRVEEFAGNLRRAFEGMGRRNPYSAGDVVLFSATTAHYLQDATQPLHATENYDGFKTGNAGVHGRFESELLERYASQLTLTPRLTPIANPRDFAFDTLIDSYGLVDGLMAADKTAIGSKEIYDDAYFEAFFAATKPMIERRLSEAISATAGLIVGAWEQAGKPTMYTSVPRQPQKVRR